MLKQDGVWWQCTGKDRYNKPTYAAAVAIKCRWDIRQEMFVDEGGTEVVSEAVVYVDRDMTPGDVLMLGLLATVGNPAAGRNPLDDEDGAYRVRGWKRIGNVRQTEFVRGCYL
jgi:hypothetical protein